MAMNKSDGMSIKRLNNFIQDLTELSNEITEVNASGMVKTFTNVIDTFIKNVSELSTKGKDLETSVKDLVNLSDIFKVLESVDLDRDVVKENMSNISNVIKDFTDFNTILNNEIKEMGGNKSKSSATMKVLKENIGIVTYIMEFVTDLKKITILNILTLEFQMMKMGVVIKRIIKYLDDIMSDISQQAIKKNNTSKINKQLKGNGEFIKQYMDMVKYITDAKLNPLILINLMILKKVIKSINNILTDTSSFANVDPKSIKNLELFSKTLGTLIKSVTMVSIIGVLAPVIMLGTIVLKFVIKQLASLGDKKFSADLMDGFQRLSKSLLLFSASMLLFALTLVVVGEAVATGWKIMMMPLLLLTGILLFIYVFNKFANKEIPDFGRSLIMLSLSILLLTLTVVLISETFNENTFKSVGIMSLIMGSLVLSMILLNKAKSEIKEGGKSILFLSGGVLILTITLIIIQKFVTDETWKSVLILTTISGLLVGMMLLLSLSKSPIKDGGKSMLMLAGGVFVLSLTLLFLSKIPMENVWSKMLILTSLVGLMMVMIISVAVANKMGSSVTKGSMLLITMGATLLLFSYSLKLLVSAIPNPKHALKTVGILGLTITMMIGIATAIGAVMMSGIGAAILVSGTAMLISLSVSLLLFAKAMKNMGAVVDTVNPKQIGKSVGELLSALVEPLTTFGIASMKDASLRRGIRFAGKLSNMLSNMATALKTFTTFEFAEMIYDDNGNITGSKPTKGKVDPIAISSSIALLLNSLSSPLREFGKEDQELSGNPSINWLRNLTSQTPLARGLRLGNKLSTFMANMANGLKTFSTLEFNVDGVQRTKGKIDIPSIISSITMMLDSLKTPIINFANDNPDVSGIIGKGINWIKNLTGTSPLAKGLKLASELGIFLSNTANGLKTFAKMEFVQYGNDGKTIIGGSAGQIDVNKISNNISTLLFSLKTPIEKFGNQGKALKKGLKMVHALSEEITNMVSNMKSINNFQFNDKELLKMFDTMNTLVYNKTGQVAIISEDVQRTTKLAFYTNYLNKIITVINKMKGVNFDSFTKNMEKLNTHINSIDLKKLQVMRDMFMTLRDFSKETAAIDRLADALGVKMANAILELAQAYRDGSEITLTNKSSKESKPHASMLGMEPVKTKEETITKDKNTNQQTQKSLTASDIGMAIEMALTRLMPLKVNTI